MQVIQKKGIALLFAMMVSGGTIYIYCYPKKGFFEVFEKVEVIFSFPTIYIYLLILAKVI